MLTAGSGITPVMSMIRTLVPRRPDADVVLIHSARTAGGQPSSARNSPSSPTSSPTSASPTGSPAKRGRMDFTHRRRTGHGSAPTGAERAAYACGPEGFLDDAEALWAAEAAATDSLTHGRATPRTPNLSNASTPALPEGVGHDGGLVTFEASDREVEADGDTPLLDVGEDAGVLMPSGCRMGICHSCLIPLLAGQVRDLRTGEVHGEPGQLIQTCVSAAAGPVNLDI